MKLKKGTEKKNSDDVYYDLFDGGYINPEELLDSEKDIKLVNDAMDKIRDFLYVAVNTY